MADVNNIQTVLKNAGLYSGPINGQMDANTVAAIRDWQARLKVPVTGQWDGATQQGTERLLQYLGGQNAQGMNASPSGPNKLPAGGVIYRPSSGGYFVVYDLGQGVKVRYSFDANTWNQSNLAGLPVRNVDATAFHKMGTIDGGSGAELWGISQKYQSYKQFFDHWLTTLLGGNREAANDPQVRKIYTDWIANPELTEAEIKARLQLTPFYKKRTDAQREWNDLSPAEQNYRKRESAARLQQLWFQNVGTQLDPTNKNLLAWAENVASGEWGEGYVIERLIKPRALKNPESPWSRIVRKEQEEHRQRPIDIENKANEVRQLYQTWGIQPEQTSIKTWATDILANRKSDADLFENVKAMARALYPTKDPELETKQWAQPWLQTYSRILERPADIFHPKVQEALTNGTAPYLFEQQLRASDEWLNTQNSVQTLTTMAANMGRRMGFNN